MSLRHFVQMVDEVVNYEFTTDKSSNLMNVRVRLMKIGNPLGSFVVKIMNQAMTETIATSASILCNFTSETEYVGSNFPGICAVITTDFNGEAIRSGVTYVCRIEPDSTYFSGFFDHWNFTTWVLDAGLYKGSPAVGGLYDVFKGDTAMTEVDTKPEVDDATKYYYDNSNIFTTFDGTYEQVYGYHPSVRYIGSMIDYPKPTNDNGAPQIETTHGRAFTSYPLITQQLIGRDYGI